MSTLSLPPTKAGEHAKPWTFWAVTRDLIFPKPLPGRYQLWDAEEWM